MQSRANLNNTSANARCVMCKICKAEGESVDVYTSHATQVTLLGVQVITCPRVLESTCRVCNCVGHRAGFCRVRAMNDKSDRDTARYEKYEASVAKQPQQQKLDPRANKATRPANVAAAMAVGNRASRDRARASFNSPGRRSRSITNLFEYLEDSEPISERKMDKKLRRKAEIEARTAASAAAAAAAAAAVDATAAVESAKQTQPATSRPRPTLTRANTTIEPARARTTKSWGDDKVWNDTD